MLFNERSTAASLAEFDKSLTCAITLKMADTEAVPLAPNEASFVVNFSLSLFRKSVIHQSGWPS